MKQESSCPCGSGLEYSACCESIVNGNKLASTPEQLMRSRYTAHVYKNIKHIMRTMHGKALKLFDREKTEDEWFARSIWQKLEIIEAKDDIVEFKAYYLFDNTEQVLHERSKFAKIANQWFYISGQNKAKNIETSAKVGRNELCPCGSERKYKKCCAVN